jgi:hypothetical protein
MYSYILLYILTYSVCLFSFEKVLGSEIYFF